MLLKFSEWIDVLNENCELLHESKNVEEARNFRHQQSPTNGAFGKKQGYSHSRDDQRNLQGNYQAQIAFGKAQEQKIFAAAIQHCGLKVTPASTHEDKFLKIDGWWWPNEGAAKEPFSMKYRDTGPDVLFEVIKPFVAEPILDPQNKLGRDVKPPGGPANAFDPHAPMGAKFIMFLSKEGNKLSIIPTEPCYQIIGNMLHEVNSKGWNQNSGGRKAHVTSKGVLRLQTDGSSGKVKVMAYLPMRSITPVFQCNVNVSIG